MNEKITSMEQVSIGDIIKRDLNGRIESLVVTTKFASDIIEGIGFKGSDTIKQRRFFLDTGFDYFKVGHVDFVPILRDAFNDCGL